MNHQDIKTPSPKNPIHEWPEPMSRAPKWARALGVTLLMQVTSTFLAQAMPVIAPTLTAAAGVPPENIGALSSIISLGTLWFLASGHVLLPRWGAVRVLQVGSVLGAVGVLVGLTGSWPAMMAAALLLGLAYGPAPPAGSDILMRHSPRSRRALIFSTKQAGAPFGSAVAGLVLPGLVAAAGWRWALVVTAVVSAASAFMVEPWRREIDSERQPAGGSLLLELLSIRTAILPFRVIASSRPLLWLAGTGFSFACVQGCIFSFYVTYLNAGLGLSLTAAGTAFALLQAIGMVARIAMGFLADRLGSGVQALIYLGLGSCLASVLAAALGLDLPWPAVLAISAVVGLIGVSWNGVFLAEVARLAPEGRVSEVTSGTILLTFLGYVVAPAAFTAAIPVIGGYGACFLAIAGLPLISVAVLLRVKRMIGAGG
ncbi:MAG TPA: MFS transporter [Stellaceae bacterium]|nr:MFS transporter [Stellaceae bacterium]